MEDIMIKEYLKEKGLLEDYTLHQAHAHPDNMNTYCADKYDKLYTDVKELTYNMPQEDKEKFIHSLIKYTKDIPCNCFDENSAKYTVSKMWSMDNSGRKWIGEKFDMYKAKEVCERYRGILPQTVTHADVYVAINSQFHDYHCLYKAWFGEDISHQIIESAMAYWFKDADYDKGCKIWNYFKES